MFALRPKSTLPPTDHAQAAIGFERWREAAAGQADTTLTDVVDAVAADGELRPLLDTIFANSAFLTSVIEREPAFIATILVDGPERAYDRLVSETDAVRARADEGRDPSAPLRSLKRRIALLTALADIADLWSLKRITHVLSDFASDALACVVTFLLHRAASRGIFSHLDPTNIQRGSGLIILGMGKLGARELNYSSDIDLIVLYDLEASATPDRDGLQRNMVRLTRDLVTAMDGRTPEGYVFRTDLRLRPDPSVTPLAVSTLAAETYYETVGQNWERAALIKARPVAGDILAGERFLEHIRPFIWRRNLDFVQISDVRAIKQQIYAHFGGSRIRLPGHNLKLGRGGIREIEFFAQTQQLIWGGRIPELRIGSTVSALQELVRQRMITKAAESELTAAYDFLRRAEHRLQIMADEQTHSLPADPAKLDAFARFFGYPETKLFEQDLLHHLRIVEHHYAHLFEDMPAAAAASDVKGNLVFTGTDPDPGTRETLLRLGFSDPDKVDEAVRNWHRGRSRATRTARARAYLTEIHAALLKSIGAAPDPDACFLAFDRFIAGLPSGTQLFAMLSAHPELLDLLIEIMGRAPRLAEYLARHPGELDSVLTADFFEPPPPWQQLQAELSQTLRSAHGLEDALICAHRWANDRKFQVGVQSLRGLVSPAEVGLALSNIADAVLQSLLPVIETEFVLRHGRIEGSDMAVIAMGKLGGREMTPTSDLDLIFVYGTPAEDAFSDGPKPLAASQWFARLSKRFINALTAMTVEGSLYEVDMRLRPSGKAGPLAVSLQSFERYQMSDAWTWERMALTRARVISGPPALVGQIDSIIRSVLTSQRDGDTLVVDVADMRVRMDAEHGTDSIWEVKHHRGGLVDIEFIAQYLQLRHAAEHPNVLSNTTATALASLRDHALLDHAITTELLAALDLWQAIQCQIRLTLEGRIAATGAADAPQTVRRALDGLQGLSIEALEGRMREMAARCHAHYVTIIDEPAKAAREQEGAVEP